MDFVLWYSPPTHWRSRVGQELNTFLLRRHHNLHPKLNASVQRTSAQMFGYLPIDHLSQPTTSNPKTAYYDESAATSHSFTSDWSE
jgi:hypothetical protein